MDKKGSTPKQRSSYPKEPSGDVDPFNENLYRNNEIIISDFRWLKLINFYIIINPSLDKYKKTSTVQYFDIKDD